MNMNFKKLNQKGIPTKQIDYTRNGIAISMDARTPTPQTQPLTTCQHTRNGIAVSMDAT